MTSGTNEQSATCVEADKTGGQAPASISISEAANLLYSEYDRAHALYWKLANLFSLAILTISFVPFVKPDIVQPLGVVVFAFPLVAFLVTLCASWILAAENQRIRMVRKRYDQLMGKEFQPVRMPLDTVAERWIAKPIGSAVTRMFLYGFGGLCVANAWVLSRILQ